MYTYNIIYFTYTKYKNDENKHYHFDQSKLYPHSHKSPGDREFNKK